MSAPAASLPRTSARAVALASVLGVLALTAHEPRVVLGVLSGGAVAAAVAFSSGGHSRALAAALLPAGVLGTIGVLTFASGGGGGPLALTALAVPLGVGLSVVVLGGGSTAQLREVGTASLYAAVFAACGTMLPVGVAVVGSPSAVAETLLWVTGRGAVGLALAVVAAGVAVAGGIRALPSAALAPPEHRGRGARSRNTAAWAAVVGSIVVAGLLVVLLVLATLHSVPRALVDWLAGTPLVRVVLLGVVVLGIGLAAVGLVARWSWADAPQPPDPVFAIFGGTVCGFLGAGTLIVLLRGPLTAGTWTGLLALAALVFGIGWVGFSRYADLLEAGVAPTAQVVVALALGASGAVVGTNVAYQGEAAGANVAGLAALVALAAGFFVYRAGGFGHTLGAEVGPAGATRRPQLVRLGWIGAVTVAGLVVAALGLWVATVIAPTLSVPAAGGVVAGTAALLAGTWLLLR